MHEFRIPWAFLVSIAVFCLAAAALTFLLLRFLDGSDTGTDPISILPREPDGVMIVLKKPEAGQEGPPAVATPVAQGADRAQGYAIELGAARSFSELSQRFAGLAQSNAELEFNRLEPRAILVDTSAGLEARLLVGPFENQGAAQQTCANIALPAGITCKPVEFAGELIARE